MVEIPYCEESEKFFQIGNYIENKKNSNTISCYRKKTVSPLLKIYYGICDYDEDYASETERNTKTKWSEHNNLERKSEPDRHILNNVERIITWTILAQTSKKGSIRKNVEALFVAQLNKNNEQK